MYFRMSKSSSGPQTSSTPMDTSRVEEFYVNIEDEIKESDELNKSEDVNLETVNPLLSLHRKKLRLKTLSNILRDQEDQKFGMIFLNLK